MTTSLNIWLLDRYTWSLWGNAWSRQHQLLPLISRIQIADPSGCEGPGQCPSTHECFCPFANQQMTSTDSEDSHEQKISENIKIYFK